MIFLPSVEAKTKEVPENILAEARRLVEKHRPLCFWFWHPTKTVTTWDDVLLVIKGLREYGRRAEWQEAQALWKLVKPCL